MLLWTNRYNGLANRVDSASAIAVAPDGGVYVTGSSEGTFSNNRSTSDYITVKYVTSKLTILPCADGSPNVNLTVFGVPNSAWSMERSMMIGGPWTNIGTVIIESNGATIFQDTHGSGGKGFYRTRQP